MVRLKCALFVVLAAAGLIGSSGCCCCCSPCNSCGGGMFHRRALPDDYRGAGSYWCGCGCGEVYLGDWHSFPPKCEPCDCCGNYTGGEEQCPSYQLPPRVNTIGRNAGQPMETTEPTPPPESPTPPTAPTTSRRTHRSSAATQATYEAPQHCATCGT